MGDIELCNGMLERVEQKQRFITHDGATRLQGLSVLTNMAYIAARLHRPDVVSAEGGPRLEHVDYPAVLVVRAVERDGALQMTLAPGNGPVNSTPLKFARLAPHRQYRLITAQVELTLAADGDGEAVIDVPLVGRSRLTLRPQV